MSVLYLLQGNVKKSKNPMELGSYGFIKIHKKTERPFRVNFVSKV